MQGLQQRTGIIEKDVGHLARRQARFDDVIAIRASWPSLDGDGHVWMLRGVRIHERLGCVLGILAVVNEVGQRDRFISGRRFRGCGSTRCQQTYDA